MTHILYLAAGSARRFGSNKLLTPLRGKPLFAHGLETLMELSAQREDCRVTVVARSPEILAAARAMGAEAVESPLSEKGLSYTIKTGIQAVGPLGPEDALMFVLADQPRLHKATLLRLLQAAEKGCQLASVCFEGEPSSPTLFGVAYLPQLLALEGDRGGRGILEKYREKTLFLEAESPEELWDLDLPEQMERFLR